MYMFYFRFGYTTYFSAKKLSKDDSSTSDSKNTKNEIT